MQGTFGYGARGGYRWDSLGVFIQLEQNFWLATEVDSKPVYGAINIGLGGELIYAAGFVRTSLSAGPSILAFDTELDEAEGEIERVMESNPSVLVSRPTSTKYECSCRVRRETKDKSY